MDVSVLDLSLYVYGVRSFDEVEPAFAKMIEDRVDAPDPRCRFEVLEYDGEQREGWCGPE